MVERKRRWLLGLVALGGVLLLAGPAAAQGVLRVGVASNLNTLDPPKMKIGEEYVYNYLVFNALTQIGPDMKVRPDLAERWESSADLKTWTFYLRKGVKFHHGRELDAEDVIASVNRILDKATGSPARVNLLVIKDVTAVDKHTVRFNLNIAYSGFAEVMGDRITKITPRDRIDALTTAPVGTGPFKFKEFVPGDHLTMVKNPDYFEKGVPVLDEVVLRIIPESAALTTALEAGSIDLILYAPLEAIEKMKGNPALVVDSVPSSSWDAVVMRCDIPPFNNVKLRQAVAAAADKPGLVQVALFGQGTPTHTAIAPSHPFFSKTLAIRKPDAALGKKLMTEAGFPNGLDIKLFIPAGRPARERVGVTMREMLKPIGLRADLQRVPWDKFVADIEGKAEFNVDGFFSRPTVDTAVYPWYHSTGSWNAITWHYSNPKVDQLLDQARATASEDEQRKLYQEFQAIVDQEVPGVVPYVVNHVNAYRKEVKGFKSTPMMWLDLRRVTVSK
jgi:peptide/nickel transport system substrate-binding protein